MKQKINNLILPYGKPGTGKYMPKEKESFKPTDIQKRIEDMVTNGAKYDDSSDYEKSYVSRFGQHTSDYDAKQDMIKNSLDFDKIVGEIKNQPSTSIIFFKKEEEKYSYDIIHKNRKEDNSYKPK